MKSKPLFPLLRSGIIALLIMLSNVAQAAFLDPTFDGDGSQSIDVGQLKLNIGDNTAAMALQGDGKVVLVGQVLVNGTYNFAVTRLNTNGTLDTSFNQTGKLVLPVGAAGSTATDVAVQKDGKIVVSGNADIADTANTQAMAVVRLNNNGSLDTSFDGDGQQLLPLTNGRAYARAMALQSDGKILVAGDAGYQQDFAVMRLNTNGSFDTAFDNDGFRTISFAGDWASAGAVALLSDGKIVLAGDFHSGSNSDVALARLNRNGSLDTTFNNSGQLVFSQSGGQSFCDLAVYSDKLVVEINDYTLDNQLSVLRLNVNGSLDTTFGGDGKVVTSFAVNSIGAEGIPNLALQNDGKIVVAATAQRGDGYCLAVARFNVNGSDDTSFSGDGQVIRPLQGGINSETSTNALAVQGDNKIVLAVNGGFSTLRLNANGSLDTGFLNDVPFYTRKGNSADTAHDVVLQSDGKSIVVGAMNDGLQRDFGIARLNLNGSLDSSFAGTGKVVVPLRAGDDIANAVAMQNDGKIVVVGTSTDTANIYSYYASDFAIVRLNPDGSLDSSFDGDGKLILPMLTDRSGADAVIVQSDGKIVVAGSTTGFSYDFAVTRLNADGSLDTTFGNGGRMSVPTNAGATSVAVQANGSIVLVGNDIWDSKEFIIVRLRSNGSLDTTFSGDGKLLLPVSPDFGRAQAVAIQSDGNIVVAGEANDAGQLSLAIVRLRPSGSLDTTFSGDGKLFIPLERDALAPTDMALQPDGKIVLVTEAAANAGVAVFRVTADGNPDTTFDGDGKFSFFINYTDSTPIAVAVQNDGKIVIAGDGYYPGYYLGYNFSGSTYDFFVARVVPNDPQLSVSNTRAIAEGSATTPGSTIFTISLSDAYAQPISVKYATADGTGKAGEDYQAVGGSLLFAPGQTAKRVRVPFIGDIKPELNGTFFLDLKTPTNASLADSRGVATIRNDDGPTLSIENAIAIDEGNSGTTEQKFIVRLSAASPDTVTVNWATVDGMAGIADYVAASGTLTFTPGQTSKLITILVNGDTAVESNETYKVTLSKPAYAVIGDAQGIGTIRNDDAAPLLFQNDEPSQ